MYTVRVSAGLWEGVKEIEREEEVVCVENTDSVDVVVVQTEEEIDGVIEVVNELFMVAVAHEVRDDKGLVEEDDEIEREEEVVCVEDTESVGVRVGL